MKDPTDKVRLNKALQKEKSYRTFYTYWAAEMNRRRNNRECPKCGSQKWIKRGSGFYKTWMCDNCGLVISRKDWITGQIWWDYVKKFALDELKRIKSAKRISKDVKFYEKDKVGSK